MLSGASRGIGRAVLTRLLCAGFSVSAGVRDPSRVPEAERLLVHRYDAHATTTAAAWVAATVERFGVLHGLVNAAGINTMAKLSDEDDSAFDELWAVNVKAPRQLVRLALPHLAASGSGRVINIASLSGKRVKNDNLGYAMSKFALVALTQAIRREGWAAGIRATSLCPGFVATDMTAAVTTWPREQMTDPHDLAAVAELLLLLPNTASISELLVNCRHEDFL
jgi:NAD(P)-dependent dehydrogenase (short-subunit alcohol dehydrogenase family)